MDGPERSPTAGRTWLGAMLPAWLAAAAVTPAFVLGQRWGFIADVSLAVLLGALAVALVTTSALRLLIPPGRPLPLMGARLAVVFAATGAVMYLVGWGAVLAIGLVFVAAEEIRLEGARAARVAMCATLAVVALGESAVAAGWIETLLPTEQSLGLGVLVALGACFIIGVLGVTAHDKEQVESSLRNSETRLQALVEHAADAIVVMAPDGSFLYASPATERVLGRELNGFAAFDVHPDHIETARAFFRALVADGGSVAWIDLPVRHADGTFRWFEIGVSNRIDDPSVGGVVLNMRDITERRSAQEQLTFQAYHDALTKLPNRWSFLESLETALFESAESTRMTAVLFLDVDRFKRVNDSLGHDFGDRLLTAVAERLSNCLRPADVVARFGGDEFTILVRNVRDADVAVGVAQRITDQLSQPLVIGEHELFISASIGIALSTNENVRAGDLLRQADLAMYVAKEKGRARWELFDPSSVPEVVERLELEGDLWRALDNGELRVVFQPEVDLVTGQVVSTEALVRWEHPRRGVLEPDMFVPFAEESSLIVAIDRYVLEEACKWARRWAAGRPNGAPLVVSVNLSPRFLRHADVVAEVTTVLRDTGVDPRCIQIEITERSAVTDLDTTCRQLHQLRALGVRIAVDDFGTGYSSLSYLKQLPIDVLKLDKAFLQHIDSTTADFAIVRAVVTLGHALGMKVTAEGVERREQLHALRELGCDTAMGWLWSAALAPEDFAARATQGFAVENPGVVLRLRRGSA